LKANYTVYKGDLKEDKERFLKFWKEHFPLWPQTKYAWFYENNLYGQADIWLARDEDKNTIIGTMVIFPKDIILDGERRHVGIAGDLGVDITYRGHGIGKALLKESVAHYSEYGMDFIYGTPNVVSGAVCKRGGFQVVGWAVRMVKVIRSYYRIKRVVKIGFMARMLSAVVDTFLKLGSKERKFKIDDRYDFEEMADFDERFDDFWKKISPDHIMIGERTREFLNWRFANCPFKDFKVFLITNKSKGTILGYIIFRYEEGSVQISDLMVTDVDEMLPPLLAGFIKKRRNEDINIFTIFMLGSEKIVSVLKDFGFSVRPDRRSVIAIIDPDLPYAGQVLRKENWHFMEGDNDA